MPRAKGWRERRHDRTAREVSLGDVLDGVLRRPEFARGLPIGRLLGAWEEIVGPRLAAETAPLTLDRGVLVVAVSSGTWGAQARFLVDEIRRRANAALGSDVVTTVQVTVRPEAVKPLHRKG